MTTQNAGWATLINDNGRTSRRALLGGAARTAAAGTLAAALTRAGLAVTAAQGTAGAAALETELKVTITGHGYALSAQSVPAGYVLLTVTNNSTDEAGAAAVGPPAGKTVQDLLRLAATPPAGGPGALPAFLYQAPIPGGPGDLPPGGTAQAIIKLDAGDWVIYGDTPRPPAPFSVTPAPAPPQPTPSAALTLTERDMLFVGLDQPVAAGEQTWRVTNEGTQPHMLILGQVPAGTTMDQIKQALSLPENATPPPGALKPSDLQPRGGVVLQSPGTTVWPRLDLPAGRYVALCFVTDPKTGMPHAMEGMVSLFDVGPVASTADHRVLD